MADIQNGGHGITKGLLTLKTFVSQTTDLIFIVQKLNYVEGNRLKTYNNFCSHFGLIIMEIILTKTF